MLFPAKQRPTSGTYSQGSGEYDVLATGLSSPWLLKESGDYVYFADVENNDGKIRRVPKSGGVVQTVLEGAWSDSGVHRYQINGTMILQEVLGATAIRVFSMPI